jgi:hypothetical protein
MPEAIKSLKLAVAYAEDGAPADALRHALNAAQKLFSLVCGRYINPTFVDTNIK